MGNEGSMHENWGAIHVTVPPPWRLAGQLYCGISIMAFLGFFWRIFFWPEPADEEMMVVSMIIFFCVPPFCCFCLPVFIGRYPRWFVRIVGRRRLEKFIADCRAHADPERAGRATLSDPGSWLRDQRTFWVLIIIGCAVLGVVNGVRA